LQVSNIVKLLFLNTRLLSHFYHSTAYLIYIKYFTEFGLKLQNHFNCLCLVTADYVFGIPLAVYSLFALPMGVQVELICFSDVYIRQILLISSVLNFWWKMVLFPDGEDFDSFGCQLLSQFEGRELCQ